MDRDLHLGAGMHVPARALQWRFTTSGGPGGQHANRSATRVELAVAVDDVRGASPEALARLRRKLGHEASVAVDDTRSQHRNRAIAIDRLEDRMREALVVTPPRRATKPTAGARRRRLDAKRHRSQIKRERRRPADDA